jgi:molybdopterin adenylyltransferase
MSSPASVDEHRKAAPKSLRFSTVTISDTRNFATDKSGQLIVDAMQVAGHTLVERRVVPDEPNEIASITLSLTSTGLADVVIMTGGTGISPRDQTPEAILPLLEMHLPGFGELFRMLSYEEIGPAAMLSRAFAGRIGQTLVFCLPGSTNAVRLAVEKLLIPELPHLVHHSRG